MPQLKHSNAKTGGRPKIRSVWVQEIARLMFVEGITSPADICRRLEAYDQEHKLGDLPSDRTVNRYIKQFRTNAWDHLSAPFQWPESMGEKEHEVPWEAARDSLDLLRWYLERNYRKPTVRVVWWYWRVCQASGGQQATGILRPEAQLVSGTDDESIHRRLRLATQLALGEVMGRTSPRQSSHFRSVELELVFRTKDSPKDKEAYETAMQFVKSDEPSAKSWRSHGDRPVGP